jgi:hypothetical protein
VIEHGDELRQAHTSEFWFSSYLRGFYYDRLKLAFTNLQGHLPVPREESDFTRFEV